MQIAALITLTGVGWVVVAHHRPLATPWECRVGSTLDGLVGGV